MKIKKEVYEKIIQEQKEKPPETGGILGGNDGIITTALFDEGLPAERMCSYVPDVKRLNSVIKEWQNTQIEFMGIYHTHFWNVFTLSDGDIKYINRIMWSMPKIIEELYFPLIVMPERKMVCYCAKRVSGETIVNKEVVSII